MQFHFTRQAQARRVFLLYGMNVGARCSMVLLDYEIHIDSDFCNYHRRDSLLAFLALLLRMRRDAIDAGQPDILQDDSFPVVL